MAFGDITREAVIAAIAEYDELGQDQFLSMYGFERARSYVLVHDGKHYDSKAIIGAAHMFLPGQSPLTARQFSGGEARVGRLLRRLDFIVRVGDALTAGMLVNRLAKLRVYRSGGLKALYQPITLLWAFGRASRGEPRLTSWLQTQQEVSALLARYGRPGEREAVYYPIAALLGAVVGPVEHVQVLKDDFQMIRSPASSMNEKSGLSLSLPTVPRSSRSYAYGTDRVPVLGDRQL